jgi:hypothetical protein
VRIEASTAGGGYPPYFGVCLPDGWTIQGDSILCTGVYTETIYYDSLVSAMQEDASPAPEGYFWWGGSGAGVGADTGRVYGVVEIHPYDQFGLFSIDYMLGEAYHGVNLDRSDNHSIDITDEYTPRNLQAFVEETAIVLNWEAPVITQGLLGYNVYRDEQVINAYLVTDTTYTDENPLDGIHYYTVSSMYDGSEHLMQYDVLVFFGESLYVSPSGDNINSGSSFENALQTITYALSVISPDSLHPVSIFLAPGTYNPETNGEQFPISFMNYASLIGSGEDVTILDANNQNIALEFSEVNDASVNSLTVTDGSSLAEGGGILCWYSNPSIANVTVANCSALYAGGGIQCFSSSPSLENVILKNNYTEGVGGGLHCSDNSNPSLANVIISGNTAWDNGGGISCFSNSSLSLVNVTISGNSSTSGGGGIFCMYDNPSVSLLNCILWNDTPPEIFIQSGSVTATYSDIMGGWSGTGNINENPQFVDPENGDFSLERISPCIDAGNPASALDPDSTLTDMGALYFHQDMPVKLTLTPEDPPIVIPVIGGEFDFNIEVTNRTDEIQSFDLWTEIELPGWGSVEILNVTGLTIAVGDTVDRDRTQEVPDFAPAGEYTYLAYVGTYPWIVDDYYYFYFEKEGSDQGGSLGTTSDWICWGEDFDFVLTGLEEEIPSAFILFSAYPNPFNPATTIRFGLPEAGQVRLHIYNLLGQRVVQLADGYREAGYHEVTFDGSNLVSGLYFYRIQAAGFTDVKKMVLVK